MSVDLIVAGDYSMGYRTLYPTPDYVVEAMNRYIDARRGGAGDPVAGARRWRVHLALGDLFYDKGTYGEELLRGLDFAGGDAAGSKGDPFWGVGVNDTKVPGRPGGWGMFQRIMVPVLGNHDGGNTMNTSPSYLQRWAAGVVLNSASGMVRNNTGGDVTWNRDAVVAVCRAPATQETANNHATRAYVSRPSDVGKTTGGDPTVFAGKANLGDTVIDGTIVWTCVEAYSDVLEWIRERPEDNLADPVNGYAQYTDFDGYIDRRSSSSPPLELFHSVLNQHPSDGGIPGGRRSYGVGNPSHVAPLGLPQNFSAAFDLFLPDENVCYRIYALSSELDHWRDTGGVTPRIDPASPTYAWLLADLKANPDVPKLAIWHVPPWSLLGGGQSGVQAAAKLLIQYGCKAIFTGHQHNYQRFKPLDVNGVVSLGSGAAESSAGMLLNDQTCVVVLAGHAGWDLDPSRPVDNTAKTEYAMVADRNLSGTWPPDGGAGPPATGEIGDNPANKAASMRWFGAVALELRADGFTVSAIMGAGGSRTSPVKRVYTQEGTSAGSLYDRAVYRFRNTHRRPEPAWSRGYPSPWQPAKQPGWMRGFRT